MTETELKVRAFDLQQAAQAIYQERQRIKAQWLAADAGLEAHARTIATEYEQVMAALANARGAS